MPFSIIVNGYPKTDAPVAHVQGPALQGMFLSLMEQVDAAVSQRLHDDPGYRPYTLSPLGIGEYGRNFRGFQLPREHRLQPGTACYFRLTFLDDRLFPTFSRYFLARPEPTFRLGDTPFAVTSVLATTESGNPWSSYVSYADLIERRTHPLPLPGGESVAFGNTAESRRITLQFLTPTSFSKGDVDLPLPLPRLVFQSYLKRFAEFHDFPFLPDFVDLVDQHTGIASLDRLRTDTIKTRNVTLIGFTGDVTFELSKHAPPEFIAQMRLLADFAFYCGTGKKTTVGMGQTRELRIKN